MIGLRGAKAAIQDAGHDVTRGVQAGIVFGIAALAVAVLALVLVIVR